MKKKVLFIEYVLQIGHVNFNRIHIDALLNQYPDTKLIMHRKMAESLPYTKNQYALILPRILDHNTKFPLLNRIYYIITLIYIKMKISFKSYDTVILSYFDELTLGIIPLSKEMLLICHRNAADFGNSIKRFFMQHLAKHNSFIIFNQYQKEPFDEYGIKNVYIISHGCVKPFQFSDKVKIPFRKDDYQHIIFHPSKKHDSQFIHQMLISNTLNRILKETNTLLLINGENPDKMSTERINFISESLSLEAYQQIFLKSDIILLVYPSSFQYQVSGVGFECVANKKRALILDHPSLRYCRKNYNYDPIFTDINEFGDKIKMLLNNEAANCIVSAESFTPNYSKILQ